MSLLPGYPVLDCPGRPWQIFLLMKSTVTVWHSGDRVSWQILIKKNQADALISQIYFWNKTLHVSDSSSVHHQESITVYTAMVYVIQVCWELASRIRTELQFRPDPARELYDIYHCCVYSEKLLMMDRGTVWKHVEFYSKINLRN